MGDAFAMPDVKKELPYIGNTKDSVWFLAFENGELAGFMAVENTKGKVVFKSGYVYPEFRTIGVFGIIFDARYNYVSSQYPKLPYITTCATPNLMNMLYRYGFTETRKTKNYTFMEAVKND